jgi:hypothetical protein
MEQIFLWAVNGLLVVVIWFMREAYLEVKARVMKLEDNTVKKDDFKEFKEEFFRRFDRLEQEVLGRKNG